MFKDEAVRQAWAHLNVHNLLIRLLYTEWLAQFPAAEAERMAEHIKSGLRSMTVPPDADPDALNADALGMLQDAQHLADRFFAKALAQAAERRGQ